MALSLGSGSRRRWACRAAHRGGKGGAGCRHFHVHYHFPRQVCAFSPVRLPAFFSLLPYLLIPPVLFFAVLALLVCLGWFTLVYFVSALLRKWRSDECLQSASDANELCRNEQREVKEERAAKRVGGCSADFASTDLCVEAQQIKEVLVDGFSDEPGDISRMDLSDICTDEHASCEKLVEEVMIFETNCKEFREVSYLDVSSEKQQQQDMPVECFVEVIRNRKFCTSCDTAKLLHPQSGEEFVRNRMETPPCDSPAIWELTDKHETSTVVVNSSDNSAYGGLGDEEKIEIKQEKYRKCRADLPDDICGNKLPENIFEEQHDKQQTVTDLSNKVPEDDFMEENRKHISVISDEIQDLNNENEIARLPLDSACENNYSTVVTSNASCHHTNSYGEEVTENDRAKASGTSSLDCDFTENHQAIREEIGVSANLDNIRELDSLDNSVIERTEDEDKDSSVNIREIASHQEVPATLVEFMWSP